MRFPARLACALLVLGLASPASASLIPDPTIGVRGGGFGSPLISDGSWYQLQTCAAADSDLTSAGFLCQYYQYTGSNAIDTLAFQTADRFGTLFVDGSYTLATGFSDPDYLLVQDANTAYFQYFPGPALMQCPAETTCEFTFFFKVAPGEAQGPFQVSLRGYQFIGGVFITNPNLTDPSPIPEPAAALLLALGTAFAARRLRRR